MLHAPFALRNTFTQFSDFHLTSMYQRFDVTVVFLGEFSSDQVDTV